MSNMVHTLSAKLLQNRPEIRPGFTVRVSEKIKEGEKERVQIFEGLVISVHKGLSPTDTTFTVRKIASGVGVERVYCLHSPLIVKVDVKKVAKVRRAKLFFLRGRQGKSARLSERFTNADEYALAVAPVATEVPEEEIMVAEESAAPEAQAKTEETSA